MGDLHSTSRMFHPFNLLLLLFLSSICLLVSCSSDSEDRETVLDIPIDANNDSLLDFDTLIVQVISGDSAFIQEVFRGRLRDPRKLLGLVLDPKVGREFNVLITGYRAGRVTMRREYPVHDLKPGNYRDLPVADTGITDPQPTLEILSPAGDTAVNTTQIVVHYKLAGIRLQRIFTLQEGPNQLRIDTLHLSRSLFDTITVTLDRTPPRTPLLSGLTPVKVKRPTWTWRSGGGGGIGDYRVSLDDHDMSGDTTFQDTAYTPTFDLVPGPRTLFVQEKDLAGNWSEAARWTIVIDLTPPQPPLPGSGMSAVIASRRPAWSWTGGGGGIGQFRFKLDDEGMQVDADTTTRMDFLPSTDLGDGPHNLYVQERDSAGNWSALSALTIRVDLTPPSPPAFDSTPYSPVVSPRPTWTWKGGGNGYGVFRFKIGDSDLTRGADTGSQTTFQPDHDLPEGRHTVWVQERDSIGNWSAPASRSLVVTTRGRVGGSAISEGGTTGHQSTLAIDHMGGIYVSYQDFGIGGSFGRFTTRKYSGTAWQSLGGDLPGAILFWTKSFTLNPAGIPYAVVLDSLEKARFLSSEGSWSSRGVEPMFPSPMGEPAIAFTSTSVPFVAFRDQGRGGKATVIKLNEDFTWNTVGTRGFSNAFSIYFNLAINKNGIPIVSYLESTDGISLLKVKRFLASTSIWDDVGEFPVRSHGNGTFNMLLDAKDSLFIALGSHESGGAGEVWKFDGTAWIRVGEPLYPSGTLNRILLEEDQSGRKYAAYTDATKDGAITLKAYVGGKWIACGPPGFTPRAQGGVAPISMDFDLNGVPHLLFHDLTNGSRATVYRTGFDP